MIMRGNKGTLGANHLCFNREDKTSFFSKEGSLSRGKTSSFILAGFRRIFACGELFAGRFRIAHCGYLRIIAYTGWENRLWCGSRPFVERDLIAQDDVVGIDNEAS